MAATHAYGKAAKDKIFGASAAAKQAIARYGKDKVVDATIGTLLDDDENLVCLPTVEKVLRQLPTNEMVGYASIAGLPEYLEDVIETAFLDNKPEAYYKAIATAGGTGAIHHTIWNYSEIGDTVLTSDWCWGAYKVLADALIRKFATFKLLNERQAFNFEDFSAKVKDLLNKQNSLVIILNTPAHNPTGYTITNTEWDEILDFLKDCVKNETKKITLLVDVAYLDFAGDKVASRAFMRKFTNLPRNLLVVIAYSMSKGYTVYGQRTGAMIGISSDKDVISEFVDINQYICRATWSNINRGCMWALSTIYRNKELQAQVEAERAHYYELIRNRANIFTGEAQAINLNMLPYSAGFFLSIPSSDPDAVCEKLHEDLIFAVPLAMGVRIAVCAVPTKKIPGIAAKVAKAIAAVEQG